MFNEAKRKSTSSAQIENDTSDLLNHCLQAFHVFADLPQLSEDMRVLSLNAELAAGRAGEKGTGVRALTQYTRELVNRLNSALDDMTRLKSQVYANSATAIRTLRQNSLMEGAGQAIRKTGSGSDSAGNAMNKINDASISYLEITLEQVRLMTDCAKKLDSVSDDVSGVGSQAASISTNIAIEAALSGQFEDEFRQVANTMQDYVDQLRTMGDDAGQATREAAIIGRDLQIRARENLNIL